MKILIEKSKEILEGETLEEAFLRLPGNVIGNELFVAQKELAAFYSSQTAGNDVDIKNLNKIIKDLNTVKKAVKKFNKPEDVPVSYQYKK
tara:strand:+ start:297 stop:566 length:270 start_codon:yes stop_codon:yes gene_type:complete